ncbi:2,3-bisphosphoglycerate-independent phosphoglycerate mutase [Bacteroidia bacterium]|nr:2,3-bisphosphoglycerate-independent phosphoglycerate mutase [Bacteroidia bacterium]
MTKPLVLCILDGVGIAPSGPFNAVTNAKMPFYNGLLAKYPHTELAASGTAVGLPPGIMGNSEVGHITIGSGRIVNQFMRRFQVELESGALPSNPHLIKFIEDVKLTGGIVHILGMMSDIGVHSDMNQTIALARIVMDSGLKICVHFFSDGRDTPPKAAEKYIEKFYNELGAELESGRIFFGTLIGRYYAMDRNLNWDRTRIAFDAIAMGRAEFAATDIRTALRDAYARGETDEFIKPIKINPAKINGSDGILFCNFRADRARQMLKMLVVPTDVLKAECETPANKQCVSRPDDYVPPHSLGLAEYGGESDKYCPALLPDEKINHTLGDAIEGAGLSQLRISETEKYTHATYYMDGERTIEYPHGEKILVPSPAVATFESTPEMSAGEITDIVLSKLNKFDVIVINYANGDIIGHTGIMDAAVRSMEFLDTQLARLVPAVLAMGGTILITADHGNIEKMWDEESNSPQTAHTTNLVPFLAVSDANHKLSNGGGLSDIAPTMLKILGIKQPTEMTGHSLIE